MKQIIEKLELFPKITDEMLSEKNIESIQTMGMPGTEFKPRMCIKYNNTDTLTLYDESEIIAFMEELTNFKLK